MTPAEAEKIIGDTGNADRIGRMIAALASKTPGVYYRSQDILDHIGNQDMSAAFTLAAIDHIQEDPETSYVSHWRSTDEDAEVMNLFSEFTPFDLDPDLQDSPQLAEAIATLSDLDPEVLRKVMGRLVDRAGGLFILHPPSSPELGGKGAGYLLSVGRDNISPQGSFRFSAIVMMAGEPDRAYLLQMLCAREGGPMPEEGQKISDFEVSQIAPTIAEN